MNARSSCAVVVFVEPSTLEAAMVAMGSWAKQQEDKAAERHTPQSRCFHPLDHNPALRKQQEVSEEGKIKSLGVNELGFVAFGALPSISRLEGG